MGFHQFFLRRLLQTVFTVWVVLTLMWILFRIVPGDPTMVFIGSGRLTPDDIQAMRQAWGLDRPLWEQYFSYLSNLVMGDFGISFQYRRPVLEVIWPMLQNTLILMAPGLTLAALAGIGVGAWLAWHQGTKRDSIVTVLSLIPRSVPVFMIGIIVLMVFAYWLQWFPIGGIRTPGFYPETPIQKIPGYDLAQHLALPVLAAFLYFVSDPLLIMRASMLEAKGEDFMKFARATGMPEKQLRRIARRNAVLPVITYIAIMVSFAFGGQVLLEVVFSWPGMGSLMVTAVSFQDYPVAQTAFFLMSVAVIVTNFFIDMLYAFLDPRISHA